LNLFRTTLCGGHAACWNTRERRPAAACWD
jgi:hypothetical protein